MIGISDDASSKNNCDFVERMYVLSFTSTTSYPLYPDQAFGEFSAKIYSADRENDRRHARNINCLETRS